MGLLLALAAGALVLPAVLPWLGILALYLGASLLSGVVGISIDIIVVVAAHLRRQRDQVEAAASWAQRCMGCVWRGYTRWLVRAFRVTQRGLDAAGGAVAPALSGLLYRLPILAWALSPVFFVSKAFGNACDDAFNFVHDELVPVALDLAERLPLVEELLLRHAYPQ